MKKEDNRGGKKGSSKGGANKQDKNHTKKRNDNGGGGRKSAAAFTPKGKSFVDFDPDKRKDYLTGFSKRKKERRVFGLAMGELKKRKDHLEARKERAEAKAEETEKREERIKLDREANTLDFGGDKGDEVEEVGEREESESEGGEDDEVDMEGGEGSTKEPKAKKRKVNENPNDLTSDNVLEFENAETASMFGGNVTVSISYGFDADPVKPSADDVGEVGADGVYNGMTMSFDDDDGLLASRQTGKKRFDQDQHIAGNVATFMKKVSKNIGKKKEKKGWSGKGIHGAAKMKGVLAGDMKTVKKLLSKGESKAGPKVAAEKPNPGGRNQEGRRGGKGNRIQGKKGQKRK